ncbi:hypothetical protein ACWEVP_31805 [Amycolatopsis sp. NPDC003865]
MGSVSGRRVKLGRPEIGNRATLAFGDRLALLDRWAARHRKSRAAAVRLAVDALLAREALAARWLKEARGLDPKSCRAMVLNELAAELLASVDIEGTK